MIPIIPIHSLRYLEALFEDCGRIELRRIAPDREDNRTLWFDEPLALWNQARRWKGPGISLFTSISQPKPDYPRNRPLRGHGVSRYRRLLFDFDPIREKGVNSTEEQLNAAISARDHLVEHMYDLNWPDPLLAISGNGAHAQYRVNLACDAENTEKLADFYRGLASRFTSDQVKFDPTTRRPGQVCRLYGTYNRKGVHSDRTPQRLSTCEMPHTYREVSTNAFMNAMVVYRALKPEPITRTWQPIRHNGNPDYRTLDVVGWFKSQGLYRFSIDGIKHSVICPWAGEEHEISCDTDTVTWETSETGYPQFHCSHEHCEGRWMLDVIDKLGGAESFCAGK